MAEPTLRYVTNNALVDGMLREGVRAFEAAFPGRLRAYYLIGSHADSSAAPRSDVDVCVVFKDDFVDRDEEESARHVWRSISDGSPVQFDVPPFSERQLLGAGHHRIKTASVLLFGEDIRDRMPPMTLDAYLRTYWHAPFAYMAQVLRGTDRLRFPLTYPDADGEFFGYDRCEDKSHGEGAHSTKALVATVCWIATMIVGFRAGRMVGTKAESVCSYREEIGDGWADFVEAMYTQGKQVWGYRVPVATADRALLHALCVRMLAFENHYLTIYRGWLLDGARSADMETQRFVAARLGEVLFPDTTIRDTLTALAMHPDVSVRDEAALALTRITDWTGAGRSA
jgi:Nucleotidyltransferase domain